MFLVFLIIPFIGFVYIRLRKVKGNKKCQNLLFKGGNFLRKGGVKGGGGGLGEGGGGKGV